MPNLFAVVFVLIWSSGFIVGKAIVPYADPNLFLCARFGLAALLFLIIALLVRAPWPSRRDIPKQLLAGALLQGCYLGGGYWAVGHGLPPAAMALLGALQPVLTSLLAGPLLGETVMNGTWLRLALGMLSVVLVLMPAMQAQGWGKTSTFAVLIGLAAIGSLTVGSLLQKTSVQRADIRASAALQNTAATMVAFILVLMLHERRWNFTVELGLALGWAAILLSGAGTFLLVWLLRRQPASKVALLMFLAPPLAALEACLLFADRLSTLQIVGFGLAIVAAFNSNEQAK